MLTSTIEAIQSQIRTDSSSIPKFIKIRSSIQDKKYPTSKNLKKNATISTSSAGSSMDEINNSENCDETNVGCKSNINVKEIYNCLHELDEQKSKEIWEDYLCNDNFVYEANLNQVITRPNVIRIKSKNLELGDWQDGMNEWQAAHPYPSFKHYIQSLKIKLKNRKNDSEFDPELGFFVPQFKNKIIQQKPPQNSSNMNSANLNILNNTYASNKLIKELNRIASSHYDPSRRSNSATSNKRCLTIKPAALPFHASNEDNFCSQLQLRSDELDRVRSQKNFRVDYKSLNCKLAQEHLNNLQPSKANNLISLDEIDKFGSEEDFISSKNTFHKSESDNFLKNSGYLLNNNHSLNNINSKILKVSSFSVNNQPLNANEIIEKHKFYLDTDLNEINQSFIKVNSYKTKKINSSPLNKSVGPNTNSNNALYTHSSPKTDTKSLDIDLSVTNSAMTSGSTSLPPIVSGKRINLPLGQHRYL